MNQISRFACFAFIATALSCSKTDIKPAAVTSQTHNNASTAGTGIIMGSYNGFYLLNADNGATIWHFQPVASADQPCSSTAAVYKSNVIFNLGDSLYSADIRTGAIVWRVAQKHFRSAICIDSNKIYLGTRSGLRCLNAKNGQQLWFYAYAVTEQKQNHNSSPTVVNGIAYVCGASDPTLYALDAKTGALVWKKAIAEYPNYSSPCVYNNKVYIQSDSSAVALNAANGAAVWEQNYHFKISYPSPTVSNGRLYVTFDSLYCLNPETGSRIWAFRDTAANHYNIYNAPFVDDAAVYAVFINVYYKLNAATGAEYSGWGNVHDKINTDFTVSANKLIIPGVFTGTVFCQNASTDATIWTKQLGLNGHTNYDFGSPVTITTSGNVVYPTVSGMRQ